MTEDVGDPDPRLQDALRRGAEREVRELMLEVRLLVPIVAMGGGSTTAELAVPALVGADGRQALPVFSSSATLRAWRADARPVPMSGRQAVTAAAAEGYAAVVLDVAGPLTHVVEIAP